MNIKGRSAGNQSGFTMIEITLVMLVGGILLSMFGASLLNLMRDAKIRQTEIRLNEVNDALRRYASYNSRLPCAASRRLRPEATGYGIEYSSCSGLRDGTHSDNSVRIGMVPTRTLGLPDEYGYDAWGSRFIYAVTESMTNVVNYNPASAAVVIENGGTANAAYALVSVGAGRKGGYNVDGVQTSDCDSSPGRDIENCNDNATFINGMQSMAQGAEFYDDYLRFQSLIAGDEFEIPAGAVVAFRLNDCPSGWSELTAAAGRVIIGHGTFNPSTFEPVLRTPPTNPEQSYNGENFVGPTDPNAAIARDGWATRYDTATLPAPLGEYKNLPPYIVYRYCVKN